MLQSFKQRSGAWVLAIAAASAAGLLISGSSAKGQTNLLLDPGFEPDATTGLPSATGGDTPTSSGGPWAGWNNWVSPFSGFYTQVVAHSGVQSAKTFSAPNGGIYQAVNVTAGESYTASGWFYDLSSDALETGQTVDVRMTFFSGLNGSGGVTAGPIISPVFTSAAPQNTWTQFSVTAAAPAGTQSVQYMAFFNNPGGGGAMYLDDASLLDTSWNGGATDNNWSSANNWGGVAPVQYDPLVFSGTTRLTTNNDIAAGTTFYGITFTPTAGSFNLSGNAITVSANIANNSSNPQKIGINLGILQDTTVNTATSDITISGNISNVAGTYSLIKSGTHTLTLSGSNSYGGATNVTAGQLVVASAGALPAGDDLLIASGASVSVNNLGAPIGVQVGSLSVLGKLDLNNNALVVHSSSLSAVNALVQTGYNGGGWNAGTGIVSTAAAGNAKHVTALGVISNDNGSGTPLFGSGGTIASSFDGASPVDGDVLVKYTYYGDTNLDGKVDGSDYSRVDAAYLADSSRAGSVTGWYNGDFNYDGTVNGSDYTLMDNAFNSQGNVSLAAQIAQPTAQIAGTSAAVPEPSVLAMIGVATLTQLSRRRNRR